MRVGITGVGSLLGFNLALSLLIKNDWEVYGLSRNAITRTVGYLKRFPRFHLLIGDVTNRTAVEKLAQSCDVIFHLAGISSEHLTLTKPEDAISVNSGSTALIAELAGKKGIKMIFSSSTAVYENGRYPSETSPLTKNSFYGLTKSMGEQAIQIIGQKLSLRYTIFRFCRLFGVGMRRNPIYEILAGWSKKETIRLYESANSFLDFMYVKDAVRLLIRAMNDSSYDYQILNAGTGKGSFLMDIINICLEVLGEEIPHAVVNDRLCFDVADTRKLEALGFSPEYDIKSGFTDHIQVIKEVGFL